MFSTDLEHGLRIAERINTGTVELNGSPAGVNAPMGGVKASGIGRENGPEGLAPYTEPKAIGLPAALAQALAGTSCNHRGVTPTMVAPDVDVVSHLARHAAGTTYDALPLPAVEAAKKSILDTLGVILAASGTEPAVRGVIDLVRETGGRPESTVLAFGDRVPALMAAFANGAMAHCLDFDDQTPWGQHSASSIVPAAFAVAERRGGVSGREMITAVAVGQDIFARLRRNVGWRKDWNLSTVLGVFAGAAATARLLGLTPQATAHALGVASMQSSGVMEVVAGTGSNLRALYAGFSAKGAVLAALLADKGVTGVDRLFEGEYGVFATYFGGQVRPRRDTARSRPGVPGRYHPVQALAVGGDVAQPHPVPRSASSQNTTSPPRTSPKSASMSVTITT